MTRISELNWGKQRGKCAKSCSALLQVLVAARGPDGQVGSLVLLAGVIATNFHSLVVALGGLGGEMLGRILLLRLLRRA